MTMIQHAVQHPAQAKSACWRAIEKPIFIVGAARSGTTLFRNLLCSHSRIALTPETHFIKFADRWGAQTLDRPADFDAFWHALILHLQVRSIGVDLERCRTLVEETGRRDFRTAFGAIIAAHAEAVGKPRGGEKTPGQERYLRRLLDWYPDASIVFVYRDPRAAIASVLKAPWVKDQLRPRRLSAPLTRRSRRLQTALKSAEWMQSWRAQHEWSADPRVISVAYEDLVRAPEPEMRRACGFLGESWEPTMLSNTPTQMIDYSKQNLRWRDWALEHEQRAASPVSTDSLQRWTQDLTRGEVAIVEALCEEAMAALGYELSTRPGDRHKARALTAALAAVDAVERTGRNAAKALLKS
jgi:Sulfotransferase family